MDVVLELGRGAAWKLEIKWSERIRFATVPGGRPGTRDPWDPARESWILRHWPQWRDRNRFKVLSR